jgi:hypothetical protein
MSIDRSNLSYRAILILLVLLGAPMALHSATLEDSAKELAHKITVALPERDGISIEVRNISSLSPDEVSLVEQTLRSEILSQGVREKQNGTDSAHVRITLSESMKSFLWAAEIADGDASKIVLLAISRSSDHRIASNPMRVTLHSEKFWEGSQHILDAVEITNGVGKSRLVLLMPNGLLIEDRQTGSADTIEITSNQNASRDPMGNLNELGGDLIGLLLAPQVCTVNVESRESLGCSPTMVAGPGGIIVGRPYLIDGTPPAPPPGKGDKVGMISVCGSSSRFLATGSSDYTQTDSLQVFQVESSGAVAVSAELDFPGPITALHAGLGVDGPPRAVVLNLTTENYEAYRLSFSCGQ